MFGILVSAANVALAWVFRVVVVKALLFGVLLFVTTEFTAALISKMGTTPVDSLGSSFAAMSSGVLFMLHFFRLEVGLPMILSAMATGFAIRRLPIIG